MIKLTFVLFSIVKKVSSLLVDNHVQTAKLIFAEYGFLKKMVSDVGKNFTSETFKHFCRQTNIQQTITTLYNHQYNGHVEVHIKFVKHTIDTNRDIHLPLRKIYLMLTVAGLPGLAMMLFNRPIRGLLLQMNRDPLNLDNDHLHDEALDMPKEK